MNSAPGPFFFIFFFFSSWLLNRTVHVSRVRKKDYGYMHRRWRLRYNNCDLWRRHPFSAARPKRHRSHKCVVIRAAVRKTNRYLGSHDDNSGASGKYNPVPEPRFVFGTFSSFCFVRVPKMVSQYEGGAGAPLGHNTRVHFLSLLAVFLPTLSKFPT